MEDFLHTWKIKDLYYKIAHYRKYLKSEDEAKRKEIEKIFLEFDEIMEDEEVKLLIIDNEIKRLENLKKELNKWKFQHL